MPPPLAFAADRLGKASEQDELDKIIADDRVSLALDLPLEEALQEGRCPAFDLSPGQRQHLDGFHPAGQAVGDSRQGQHIRRAGEQKSTRAIVLIDCLLDRQQQVGRALDFVDDGSVQAANEAGRIGLGGLKHRLIVERDIGPTGVPHFSDERGLAGPARSHDQDHRGIRKGFLRPPLHKPLEHAIPDPGRLELSTLG